MRGRNVPCGGSVELGAGTHSVPWQALYPPYLHHL